MAHQNGWFWVISALHKGLQASNLQSNMKRKTTVVDFYQYQLSVIFTAVESREIEMQAALGSRRRETTRRPFALLSTSTAANRYDESKTHHFCGSNTRTTSHGGKLPLASSGVRVTTDILVSAVPSMTSILRFRDGELARRPRANFDVRRETDYVIHALTIYHPLKILWIYYTMKQDFTLIYSHFTNLHLHCQLISITTVKFTVTPKYSLLSQNVNGEASKMKSCCSIQTLPELINSKELERFLRF